MRYHYVHQSAFAKCYSIRIYLSEFHSRSDGSFFHVSKMKLLTGFQKASHRQKNQIEPGSCQLHLFHDVCRFADNDVIVGWVKRPIPIKIGGKRRHWACPIGESWKMALLATYRPSGQGWQAGILIAATILSVSITMPANPAELEQLMPPCDAAMLAQAELDIHELVRLGVANTTAMPGDPLSLFLFGDQPDGRRMSLRAACGAGPAPAAR